MGKDSRLENKINKLQTYEALMFVRTLKNMIIKWGLHAVNEKQIIIV